MSRGENGVHFEELFDLWYYVKATCCTVLIRLHFGGKGRNIFLGSSNTLGERAGAHKESVGIVNTLFQKVVGTVELLVQRFEFGHSFAQSFLFEVKDGLLVRWEFIRPFEAITVQP